MPGEDVVIRRRDSVGDSIFEILAKPLYIEFMRIRQWTVDCDLNISGLCIHIMSWSLLHCPRMSPLASLVFECMGGIEYYQSQLLRSFLRLLNRPVFVSRFMMSIIIFLHTELELIMM